MMRLPNCVMIGFAVIVGELIASATVPVRAAFYGFMTAFLLLAASMVSNDYFDREIDAINEPGRPLPAGVVKPPEALSFSLILGAIGFWSASNSGLATLMIAIMSVIVMVLYNARLKKTGLLGNIARKCECRNSFRLRWVRCGKPHLVARNFLFPCFPLEHGTGNC